jgi:hypothetical protein
MKMVMKTEGTSLSIVEEVKLDGKIPVTQGQCARLGSPVVSGVHPR